MSLEYLSRYLNKDKSSHEPKKRKRTHIIEDNLTGWSNISEQKTNDDYTAVQLDDSAVRKAVGFRPAFIEEGSTQSNQARSSPAPGTSKPRSGLQTKEQVAEDNKKQREYEIQEAQQARNAPGSRHEETVYRDASGRRIDIALAKQEKQRELKRVEERKRREKELGQGLVQQQQKEQRKLDLLQVAQDGFSRYAGNSETENALKLSERWNDPAAQFLTKKEPERIGSAGTVPIYKGGFAPNRFGIRPGYVSPHRQTVQLCLMCAEMGRRRSWKRL